MNDQITVRDRLETKFIMIAPNLTATNAEQELNAAGAVYCVVTTPEGEPLALATSEQLKKVNDPANSLLSNLKDLPAAIVVGPNRKMDQIVDDLSQFILGKREVKGLVVLNDGKIEGVLPRRAIAEHAGFRLRVRGFGSGEIEGGPLSTARTYACPLGDYETLVDFYNRYDPPRCPTHGNILVLKR